jgi:hypothetical protein
MVKYSCNYHPAKKQNIVKETVQYAKSHNSILTESVGHKVNQAVVPVRHTVAVR